MEISIISLHRPWQTAAANKISKRNLESIDGVAEILSANLEIDAPSNKQTPLYAYTATESELPGVSDAARLNHLAILASAPLLLIYFDDFDLRSLAYDKLTAYMQGRDQIITFAETLPGEAHSRHEKHYLRLVQTVEAQDDAPSELKQSQRIVKEVGSFALRKATFLALGGLDENIHPLSMAAFDFHLRANLSGAKTFTWAGCNPVCPETPGERDDHLGKLSKSCRYIQKKWSKMLGTDLVISAQKCSTNPNNGTTFYELPLDWVA